MGKTNWKLLAFRLWAQLDDIDTFDDWAKTNDVAYRKAVRSKVRQRWEVIPESELQADESLFSEAVQANTKPTKGSES